jgi:hypothetical protein
MTGARTQSGLNVRILLPHVVYLNQKEPLRREQVAVRSLVFDTAAKKLRVQLQNLGPNLGRVQEVTASAGKKTSGPSAGFPLFPFALRWTEVDWPAPEMPERLAIRFSKFSLDTLISATPSP